MLASLILLLQQPVLAPLDFLVGHCWQGEIAPGRRDTHCFARTPEGVRDRHEVAVDGKPVYWGETDYRWDAAAGRIRFVYRNADGIAGEGMVREASGGLDFGTADYATGSGKVTVASRWVRVGADAYDAVDSAPGAPDFDRVVRYVRVAD